MKFTLTQLRRLIRETLLLEAVCPGCGRPDAYVGATSVECPSKKCKFFSERQREDVITAKNKKKISRVPKISPQLLKALGIKGISGGDGDLDYESVEEFASKHGFEPLNDDYFTSYVDPKSWRVISDPSAVRDPRDVIFAGHYDEIYWEAISPEAKEVARRANDPNINPSFGNHDDAGYLFDDDIDDIGYFWDIVNNWDVIGAPVVGDVPEDMEELSRVTGIKQWDSGGSLDVDRELEDDDELDD